MRRNGGGDLEGKHHDVVLLNGRSTAPLTRAQCEAIHAASLEILRTVGVRLEEPTATKLLSEAGARVSDDNCVHISADQIDWALSRAPSSVSLYDRDGRQALVLDGSRSYYGPGSDSLSIADHRTDEHRPPVIEDVEMATALCQQLPNIDFVMSMFLPADVKQSVADRHQMRAMLNHTTKPIVFVSYDLGGCVDAVTMAQEVAGGAAPLSEHPFIACYINTATGLVHNRDAVAKLLFLAERGIPALYIPGCISSVTGPTTLAGSVAVINAGMLGGPRPVSAQAKRRPLSDERMGRRGPGHAYHGVRLCRPGLSPARLAHGRLLWAAQLCSRWSE